MQYSNFRIRKSLFENLAVMLYDNYMLVFASISLKMCLVSGAAPQTPLRGLQRSPDPKISN